VPYFNPPHLLSNGLIFGGFILLASAWRVLYEPQRERRLATAGPYAYVRHPQYAGFILIMLGFLVQWPTLLTLLMFPILVAMYVRLARREEREALAEFGEAYGRYAANTPAFSPLLGHAARKQT
jgi:protein-S-isoprenylcysteine O-methyltransferase Ste14